MLRNLNGRLAMIGQCENGALPNNSQLIVLCLMTELVVDTLYQLSGLDMVPDPKVLQYSELVFSKDRVTMMKVDDLGIKEHNVSHFLFTNVIFIYIATGIARKYFIVHTTVV